MSALPQPTELMTETEYLTYERASSFRHEYHNGEVVAMAGASANHNLINSSINATLYAQLRGRGCKVYANDMRIQIASQNRYLYPDLSIVCGQAQFLDDEFDTLINPTVIFEILSASTEQYDRGKKAQAYREIESLQAYILVAQDIPHIERYVRQEHGEWSLGDAIGLGAIIDIAPINCTLSLADVYEQVTFEDDISQRE